MILTSLFGTLDILESEKYIITLFWQFQQNNFLSSNYSSLKTKLKCCIQKVHSLGKTIDVTVVVASPIAK